MKILVQAVIPSVWLVIVDYLNISLLSGIIKATHGDIIQLEFHLLVGCLMGILPLSPFHSSFNTPYEDILLP